MVVLEWLNLKNGEQCAFNLRRHPRLNPTGSSIKRPIQAAIAPEASMADRTGDNDRNGPETAVVLGAAIRHPVFEKLSCVRITCWESP